MERKWIILIVLSIFFAIIFILIFIFNPKINSSPQTKLEECKTISYNGENKINILFYGNEKDVEKYMDHFLSTSPYNKNKEDFNFYSINSDVLSDSACEIYYNVAILCRSKEIVTKSASCPHDFIIVLKDGLDSSIRSSSYNNIVSINLQHPLTVLTHELGHAFVNLAEEYTPSDITKKSLNCQSSCEKFQEYKYPIDGCFQGCSKDTFFRSVENGVMRTLNSNDYGQFNEKIIEDKLSKTSKITGYVTGDESSCLDKKYILLDGQIIEGKIQIISSEVNYGCSPSQISSGEISYSIFKDETKLAQDQINLLNIFTDAQGNNNELTGEIFTLTSQDTFYLSIPYIEDSNMVVFEDSEKNQLGEINIQKLTSTNMPCKIS